MKMQETRTFNPEMLVIARKARGLTQQQVASRLSMGQPNYSKIEAGMVSAPDEMIEKLPEALHYPKDFFFKTGRFLGIGPTVIYHRMRQGISNKLLERTEAQINVRRMQIESLLRSVDIAECKIPSYDLDEPGRQLTPEDVARAVRASWFFPSGPVRNLVKAVEDAGGIVIPYEFGTKQIDGLSQWVPPLPPLFFLNANIPGDRWRFSLAHELGHVIMHSIPRPDMEKEANRFAAELLMPSRDVGSSLQFITLNKLVDLKMYWRVSMQALLYRAKDLGSLPERKVYYFFMQMSKAGYRTTEPVDIPREQPSMLSEIIQAYLKELNYTIPEICEILAIYEDEFAALYGSNQRHLRLAN